MTPEVREVQQAMIYAREKAVQLITQKNRIRQLMDHNPASLVLPQVAEAMDEIVEEAKVLIHGFEVETRIATLSEGELFVEPVKAEQFEAVMQIDLEYAELARSTQARAEEEFDAWDHSQFSEEARLAQRREWVQIALKPFRRSYIDRMLEVGLVATVPAVHEEDFLHELKRRAKENLGHPTKEREHRMVQAMNDLQERANACFAALQVA